MKNFMRRKERTSTDAFGRSTDPRETDFKFKWEKKDRKRFYEHYFAGYDVYTTMDDSGHKKTVRQYIGALYRQEMTPKEAVRLRVIYAILAAVSSAAFLGCLFLNTASNKCWYVMLFAGVVAFFLVRFLFALHPYIWSKREMREYEFHRGAQLLQGRKWAVIMSIAGLVVATCVMFFAEPGIYTHLELFRFALLLVSGVSVWLIGVMESKVCYSELRPEDWGKS